jgi:hypothetical protein
MIKQSVPSNAIQKLEMLPLRETETAQYWNLLADIGYNQPGCSKSHGRKQYSREL